MRLAALAAATALLVLAGCGRDATPPPPAPPQPLTPPVAVIAADEFGPAGGHVAGVALWTHPTLAFNGLVIAAGRAGLDAWNIEDGEAVARLDGAAFDGVAVAYIGVGRDAQGYAAARLAGGDRAFRFYAIDNITRAFTLQSTMFISERNDARGFCLGRSPQGSGLVMYEMRADGWRATALAFNDGVVSAGGAATGQRRGGFEHCVGDDLDGAAIAVTAEGELYRLADGVATPIAATGVARPAGLGLALNGLGDDEPPQPCCGQIVLLDGETGVVRLYDREDGRALGAVRLEASFDVAAVGAATALGVGYGNYGGIYRDGVIALAVDGEEPVVRLTPFNGAMDALAAPLGDAADPRDLAPQREADIVIDIDVVRP